MNVYDVTCYSLGGSSLYSLIIIAESKEQAILLAKEWQGNSGNRFKWGVDLISSTKDKGVISVNEGGY